MPWPAAPRQSLRRGTPAGANGRTPEPRRRGVGTPRRFRASARRSRAGRLEPEQRLEHERADPLEVVAALLDDDRREAELTEDSPRLAAACPAHLERALRVAACRVHSAPGAERGRAAGPGCKRAAR